STILDALVYALYGQVAGSATSADRIRSQFAPPAEASVVDLIFETASGIHRVRRSPEYQRPQLRGTGTTKEQAQAVLWRIGPPPAPRCCTRCPGGSPAPPPARTGSAPRSRRRPRRAWWP